MNRLLLVVVSFSISFFPQINLYSQCHPDDYAALRALYLSTGGQNWYDQLNWDINSETPPEGCDLSSWQGIVVRDGRITELAVAGNTLSGSIPQEIGLLQNLEWLILSFNEIEGDLPTELTALTKLKRVNLEFNRFTGPIPSGFGNLNIEWLDLKQNRLSGSLPSSFSNLTDALYIDLRNNELTGCIPTSYTALCYNDLRLEGNNICESMETFCADNGIQIFTDEGVVFDKWNRPLIDNPITLLDWEGHMGNPESRFSIRAPSEMTYPLNLEITIPNAPLAYMYEGWGFPGQITPSDNGPSLQGRMESRSSKFPLKMAVQPDRDFENENYELHIRFFNDSESQTTVVPIHVIDQDYDRAADFEFTIDFSEDIYGLYEDNPEAVEVFETIMEDLAYYLDDQEIDDVSAESQRMRVYFEGDPTPDGIREGNIEAINKVAFNGFYIFATGGYKSTSGFPSFYDHFMKKNGSDHILHSIGIARANVLTDWGYNINDEQWWYDTGLPDESDRKISFYGVMKHEALHTLAYETNYERWNNFYMNMCIDDPDVMKYTGTCSVVADPGHSWDPILHKRQIQHGVELIDKFEILVMQAVGWKLRETTPFMRIDFEEDKLRIGGVGRPYDHFIKIIGGVPAYQFKIIDGSLPEGLSLDSHTGLISGIPTVAGEYAFTIKVEDNDVDYESNPNGVEKMFNFKIKENYVDNDKDGFEKDEDCDDDNSGVNPDQDEIANNGIDENCDGEDLLTTSTYELEDGSISIYPNPIQDILRIDLDIERNVHARIFNTLGHEIFSKRNAKGQIILNVSQWESGIYFLELYNPQQSTRVVEKLFKY